MRADRYVFVFICSKCQRRHYQVTNSLAPFVQKDHEARYFCKGTLRPKGSELAGANSERKVS